MHIVIDIPDGCYEELNNGQFPIQDAYRLVSWIKEGIPLPKGHGRLIDADELKKVINQFDYYDQVSDAQTIIEANEEEK